jgi:hypothetical protein
VLVGANSGEMFLNDEQQARLFDIANGAQGAPMSVTIPVTFSAPGFKDVIIGAISMSINNGDIVIDARKLTNLDSAVRGVR